MSPSPVADTTGTVDIPLPWPAFHWAVTFDVKDLIEKENLFIDRVSVFTGCLSTTKRQK